MEIEDEIFLEDDIDVMDIIEFGFPRRVFARPDFINEMADIEFYRRFRLRKDTVIKVLELIEDQLEFNNDLNNSVSPINQLLTALLFYSSGGHQLSISDLMKMDQSTVSRIILKVSRAIAGLNSHYIKMPSQDECIRTQTKFFEIARFPRVIGCLDCTHIKVQSPGGEDGEIFRNRKSYFSLNVQVICDSDLMINNIVARWPGSAHDSTIFNNSRIRTRFDIGEFANGILLGDSGYPLKPYLLTPLANPASRAEQLYNESHIRTRNLIERTFGIWKRRFPALCYGLRCKIETSMVVIIATAVLHNIARTAGEDMPPPPIGLNQDELDYLVQQGQLPPTYRPENINYDFRNDVIANYFANI